MAIVGTVVHLSLTPIAHADAWSRIVSAGWLRTVALQPREENLRAAEAFWSTPASFAVPLFLLGVVAVHSAREGRVMPRVTGWVLIPWGVLCVSLAPVSGAWAFILIGGLFLADRSRGEPRTSSRGTD